MSCNLHLLKQHLEMLKHGQFVEVMEKFFHDGISLWERDNEPNRGKADVMAIEKKLLNGVSKFV